MVVGGGEVSVVDRTVTIVHRGEGRVGIRGVVENTCVTDKALGNYVWRTPCSE